jgi:hypothetical protein
MFRNDPRVLRLRSRLTPRPAEQGEAADDAETTHDRPEGATRHR